MKRFILKISLVLLILCIFASFTNTPNAQGVTPNPNASIECTINSISLLAPAGPPVQLGPQDVIPENKQFELMMTCLGNISTTDKITVSVDNQSNTQNFTGLTKFGPYNGLDASMVPPQSLKSYPITVTIPGKTVDCSTGCEVRVQNTSPATTELTPVAVPLPDPTCLNSYKYNPPTPVLGQPFQIQFIPNSEDIQNGILQYSVTYTSWQDDPSTINTDGGFQDLDKTFGVWVVNISGVNGQFAWQALFHDRPCGSSDVLFPNNLKNTPTPPSAPCLKLSADGTKCLEVDTAIGTLSTDPAGFIKSVFGIILSLAGGIALLLIIISGYKLMASQGNPEAVQGAREQLTSAVVGLLFIIFSLVILQIIGVDILRIPGFGG